MTASTRCTSRTSSPTAIPTKNRYHFAGIHAYVYLDFTERQLFEDLFIESGGTRAFVTYLMNLAAIRVVDETEGLFCSVAPGTPVSGVVELVESIIR